jgi:bacterial leucyl aminopeptidase
MDGTRPDVVFFDIGGTLATPRLTPPPYRLAALDVYPHVWDILKNLREREVRMGLISNTGDDSGEHVRSVLKTCGLTDFFETDLMVFSFDVGMQKDSPQIFIFAAKRAGHADQPGSCVFVGEDRSERAYALGAGLSVCPDPKLVSEILDGHRLRYVRISTPVERLQYPWRSSLRKLPVVPVYSTGDGGSRIWAVTSDVVASKLDDLGFEVDRLGTLDLPLVTGLYLVRDDRQNRSGFLAPEGNSYEVFGQTGQADWILSSSQHGLLIALPAGRSIEDDHFADVSHGHCEKLLADVSLLSPFGSAPGDREKAFARREEVTRDLTAPELAELEKITPELLEQHLKRYVGVDPIAAPTDARIKSRHIRHPDNAAATEALFADLKAIGGDAFDVRKHLFNHQGLNLFNVEAQLAGSETDEVVLITAHFDSTASYDRPYDPLTDEAPGADDDASGVASVLACAQAIAGLARLSKPKRGIRFVLFNSEESGLVGSKAYARDESTHSRPIVAVYQMDMIGYNKKEPRSFEVHSGYWPLADVQERSAVLAQRMAEFVSKVSPGLESPQIYTSTGPASSKRDPAEGRSDHGSFHERGYAACAVSEDFFAGPTAISPAPEPNPNYHMKADTYVDLQYAADIARSVCAAAWITATI